MVRKHENPEGNHSEADAMDGDEQPAVHIDKEAQATSSGVALADKLSALFSQAEALRSEALERVLNLEHELEEARSELEKVDRLLGKHTPSTPSRKSRTSQTDYDTKGERQPRGFWLGKVQEALEGKPDGLKKAELIATLGIEGDARQIANLSSALQQGKKGGSVGQKEGRYFTA